MADAQDSTETLTAVAASTTRTAAISTLGKRDLVFSIEFSTVAAAGTDTIDVTLQHTNADSSLHSTANDNYWETFLTFAQVAGNATTPYARHMDMTQALINASTTNVKRSIGRWMRWKYVVAGGGAAFTGKLRIAWNTAVTE